jgi:hypothetical protein
MAIVRVTVERFDQYKFITSIFAYVGVFTVISFVFTLIFRQYIMCEDIDNVIRIDGKSMPNDQHNANNKNDENIPLVMVNSDGNNYGTVNHNGFSNKLNNSNKSDSILNPSIKNSPQ